MINGYKNDKDIKKQIDDVLHTNAMIMQQLGVDSTKAERQAAKVQERKNLREVRHLDSDFIDTLIKED